MYLYRLIINKQTKGSNYFFQYGNTKDVSITIFENAASIVKDFKKDYRNDLGQDSYLRNLFKEGMKRISLLHILCYQKPIKLKSIQLIITGPKDINEVYELTDDFVLYSLIGDKLFRPVSPDWRNHEVLQNILRFQKSKTDLARNVAALYSYLYSKTKTYETERFSFLWMAMNGMYGALSPGQKNDRAQMCNLVKLFNLGTEVLTQKVRDDICQKVFIKMKDIHGLVTKGSLGKEHKELEDYILQHMPVDDKTNHPVDLSAYGFLLTDFSYYLRCRFFHANRPVELFSFADDLEIKVLRIVNGLLEEFLDENLVKIFLNT